MKTKFWVWTPLLALIAASPALADHRGHTNYVYARVVRVEPVVRYVQVDRPRRECWDDVVYEPLPSERPLRDAAPALAGGVIGGVIGNQLGNRRNRGALTLLGAVAGSAIASDVATRNDRQYAAVPVERCEVVNDRVTEERILGYDVTYSYQGQRYRMRTPNYPGDRVRLRVTAVPVRF
jgi:uncharacterized protein YcfJ